MRRRVLLVDDDPGIRKFVSSNLIARGYEVESVGDGRVAVERIVAAEPDLVILDILLPSLDGLEVCRRVRAESTVPIIMLTARGDERDKITALSEGADDYLTKPFSIEELLVRVQAVLRRAGWSSPVSQPTRPLECGKLALDPINRSVSVGDQRWRLTPTEFSLLHLLVSHAGQVLTHQMLLLRVWGPEYSGEHDYLRIYIYRLRRKLRLEEGEGEYIATVPGVGYRFAVRDARDAGRPE
jgi:two-component system, OmpR family, KDP operon response regulator KdpE